MNCIPLPNSIRARLLNAAFFTQYSSRVLAGITLAIPASLQASDWTGATGISWETATNWSAGVPAAPDDAVVNLLSPNIATVQTVVGATPANLHVGFGAGANGQVNIASGSLTIAPDGVTVIGGADGTGSLMVADNAGATPATGMGSLSTTRMEIGGNSASDPGTSGNGEVLVDTSGTVSVGGELNIGGVTGSSGKLVVNAGEVTANSWMRLGNGGGSGELEINGGAVRKAGGNHLIVADNQNSSGLLTLNDGLLSVNNEIWVGQNGGMGTLNVYGGTIENQNSALIGTSGGTGSLVMTDGVWNSTGGGTFIIGNGGAGEATVSGGTIRAEKEVWFGEGETGSADVTISGSGAIENTSWVAIGRTGGNATLEMTGGSFVKTGGTDTHFIVAAGGTGVVNQSGGLISAVGVVWVGEGGNATYTLSGSAELDASDGVRVAVNASSTSSLSVGLGSEMTAGWVRGGQGDSTVEFNGGRVVASADQEDFMSGLDTAAILENGFILDTDGHGVSAIQDLSGTGGVVKSGAGTARLLGLNTYSGSTTVEEGTLLISADIPAQEDSLGDITVADGANFGVVADYAGDHLTPANVTFGTSGNTGLSAVFGDVEGLNPSNSLIDVTGNLAVNGDVEITVGGEHFETGELLVLTYDSTNRTGGGTFVLGDLPEGMSATLVDDPNKLGTGQGAVYLQVTSVTPDLLWTGENGSDWLAAGNWEDLATGLSTSYTDPSPVTFDATAASTDVVLNSTVTPNAVLFSDEGLVDFSLSGTGSISGSTGLTKAGAGTLSIGGMSNTYTGVTQISGGTVSIPSLGNGGAAGPLGAATSEPSNLSLGGLLEFTTTDPFTTDRGFSVDAPGGGIVNPGEVTLTGAIEATVGTFAKRGEGNLILSQPGTNTLSGVNGVRIGEGTLTLDGGGTQVNNVTGQMWVSHLEGISASLVANNTTLNVPSWFALGRGNGDGQTASAIFTDSTVSTGMISLGFGNGLAANDSTQLLTLDGSTTWTNTNDVTALAESADSNSTMTLGDTAQFTTVNTVHVGRDGDAILNVQDDSTFTAQRWLTLGRYNPGSGVANVDGGTVNLTSNEQYLIVGEEGSGVLNVSNGGTVNVTGPRTSIAQNVAGDGVINLMSGGTLTTREVDEGADAAGGSSTFNFDGGTLVASVDNSDFMTVDTATISTNGGTIDTNGHAVTVAQVFSGNGGLTKAGAGTLTLSGNQQYVGTTLVNEGALASTGAGTFADASSLVVGSGATLQLDFSGEDSVAALTLNGVALPEGVYNAGHPSGAITGTGSIRVGAPVANAFDNWIAGYFPNPADPNDLLPGSDPDSDGQSNAVEFMLGGSPADGGDGAKVHALKADSDADVDTTGELVLTIAVPTATPAFSGDPAPTTSYVGFETTVEGSVDLESFDSGVTEVTPVTDGLEPAPAGYEYRSFRLDASNGFPDRGFIRVDVTTP